MRKVFTRFFVTLFLLVVAPEGRAQESTDSDVLTREQALRRLNDSAWARQQTVTRVVGGVGSGVYGEKEIFGRYYVRILSARSVQEAYARMSRDPMQSRGATWSEIDDYVVIAVSFRSNDPEFEQEVYNFFQSQTVETLKTRVYVSTSQLRQIELLDYYRPQENAIGAVFVFPRKINQGTVAHAEDPSLVFEAELPEDVPDIRVIFPLSQEMRMATGTPGGDLARVRALVDETRRVSTSQASDLADVVNVFEVQKRGIVHGSIYEFHRNDNLDARNFFDPVGRALPEFKRNQFGANVGLTLTPRFRIFGSYDGLRITQGSTILSHVPTAPMKSGDFGELLSGEFIRQIRDPDTGAVFPGNRIPDSRIHPVSRRLVQLLPDPNRPDPDRNFVNNDPLVENEDILSFLVDFSIDEDRQISTRYNYQRGVELEPHPLPAFASVTRDREHEGSLSYSHRFSERFAGRWNFEFNREVEVDGSENARPAGLLDSLGITGTMLSDPDDEGYPVFDIVGYRAFGDENLPEGEVTNRLDFEADFSYVHGNHNWSFRAEIGSRQLNDSRSPALERGSFAFTGTFTGDGFADFLLGRANEAMRAIGSSRQDLRRTSYEFSVSDQWKVNSRFNLTLGLGYSYFSPYRSRRPNVSTFYPLLFEPVEGELVIAGSERATELGLDRAGGTGMVFPDYNDWSPQVGLAYRPFENNWLVVRASYAIFYDALESEIFARFMGRNYPFYYVELSQASVDSAGLDLQSPFLTRTATETTIRAISPRTSTPYEQSWNVEIQNEITQNWSFEIGYRGSRSMRILRNLPANVPLPGPGPIQPRRPNPDFGTFSIVSGSGSAEFHELEVSGQRRLADGYSLEFEFEWGRRFDNDYEEDPSNPRNLRAEWAPGSSPDRQLSVHYIWDLPFWRDAGFENNASILAKLLGGWRVSGITQLTSGSRFSVLLPGDPNNDGVGADRPDRLAPGDLASGAPGVDGWFDSGAFREPAPFTFGNAGRNILKGPSFHNWDISLVKESALPNGHRLQVRFAFFNAFNRPNFENPNSTFGTRLFGKISGAERSREIEIALKYSF